MTSPTVFITGAAAGIGRATAALFARRGYRVGAYDVDPAGLATLGEEVRARGGDISTGELDVTDAEGWSARLAEFTGESRRLDILVNNAGVLSSGPFEDIPLQRQRRIVEINVTGTLFGMHTAFPYLRDTAGAQVVNMCSASAMYGQPELATYSATKFAVRGLTEALDLEWRRHGIRVLDIWPLFVATAMVDGLETACILQDTVPGIRVVMISGSDNPAVERAARYFGAVHFMAKPFYARDIDKAMHLALRLPLPSLMVDQEGAAEEAA